MTLHQIRVLREAAVLALLTVLMTVPVPAFGDGDRPATNEAALEQLADRFERQLAERRTPLYYDLLARTTPAQAALNENDDMRLMYIGDRGVPVYYRIENLDAAVSLSTDEVWPGGSGGFSLTGSETQLGELGVWDANGVRTSHQEFGGRVTQMDGASGTHYHSTHVAGTLVAAGVQNDAKGMSYQGTLAAYEWNSDQSEMAGAAASGMTISSHSYGYVTGWYYNSSSGNYYWYGDVEISATEDYGFGFYEEVTREWDEVAYNAPYYTICKSAGNDRNDYGPGAGGGHYFWDPNSSDWEWSTATRDPDGGASGYDCTSWNTNAKNILSIGAVEDVPGGYGAPGDVDMSTFSGWGPTDDGRIKPDFVANGVGLYSTDDDNNSDYTTLSGTSMASPNAAGSINLLVRYYETVHGETPLASTMKAILMQAADETGPDDGPDYMYGWGLINTLSATELIDGSGVAPGLIREEALGDGETDEYFIDVGAGETIRVSVAWTDPPGTPPAPALDPPDLMLVNDLDVRVETQAKRSIFSPWVLNPASPSSAPSTGDNFRDNCEQVFEESPGAGTYKVTVTHKGTLGSAQTYSIVSSHELGDQTVLPPGPPAAVAASDTSCSHVYVEWSAVAEADDYRVTRDGGVIATVAAPALSWRDTVAAGTYEYGVAAGNGAGWSDSTTDSGSVLGLPETPAWLTASDTSETFVRLDWPVTAGADSFLLVRDASVIAVVPAITTSWFDTVAAGSYLYTVAAGNECGWTGTASDSGTVVLPEPPPAWADVSFLLPGDSDDTHASAWADYDEDGDMDLFLATGAGPNHLYRNDAGVFHEAAPGPLAGTADTRHAAWADYDNDGLVDIYLSNAGENRLFRNEGSGSFGDETAGPLGDGSTTTGALWGDFNNDRKIDLFLVNGGSGDRLLRNGGDGSFTDITTPPLGDGGAGAAAVWADYDNDGDGDLYLVHGVPGESRLYRNDRFGFFTDVTPPVLANGGAGVTAVWGDFDNDLDLDLYILNEGAGTALVENLGGGSFSAVAGGPVPAGAGRSAAWGDADLDGDLDLFVGSDAGVQLFRNDDGGLFADATEAELGATAGDARTVTLADSDADGDLDLFAGTFGPNRLFRNDTETGNHSIQIELVGVASNRSAIGARVTIAAGGSDQVREVSGGVGGGQSSLPVEFGLGSATVVETVEIRWPSGFVQTTGGLGADGFYIIVESDIATGLSAEGEALTVHRLFPNEPNPFNPLTTIQFEIPSPGWVRVAIYDAAGREVAILADDRRGTGRYSTVWDGRDRNGRDLPSGVYFVRMMVDNFSTTRKAVLVR